MKAARLIISAGALRESILHKIHEGYQGITKKCRAHTRESVWWSGISTEIENLVKTCPQCIEESSNNREPLIPSEFPQRPWQKIGIDLFKLEWKWYLLATDYYSRYPEVVLLTSLREVIKHLKSIFARHGTPEEVYSGTHFGSLLTSKFTQFAKEWAFKHTTSSPKFPQSNGFIESMVKIIKRGLKKSDAGYKALQSYHATPLSNGFSPAELLMGRRIRTMVPIAVKQLDPKIPDKQTVLRKEEHNRLKQNFNYDSRHRVVYQNQNLEIMSGSSI
ncbi:hypothetical protein RF55_9508 [Lasius niger]|uniref:RNA-directed DNA polymerase n=1 Tax=Lasius niger TaxID=67767 RepID=A0A0J7KK88_LASNI|nr:hypothetical protein RF55_9508 [Lasius niger]